VRIYSAGLKKKLLIIWLKNGPRSAYLFVRIIFFTEKNFLFSGISIPSSKNINPKYGGHLWRIIFR
jgi:hypothetical protein